MGDFDLVDPEVPKLPAACVGICDPAKDQGHASTVASLGVHVSNNEGHNIAPAAQLTTPVFKNHNANCVPAAQH